MRCSTSAIVLKVNFIGTIRKIPAVDRTVVISRICQVSAILADQQRDHPFEKKSLKPVM
jgi:hypothetical protein